MILDVPVVLIALTFIVRVFLYQIVNNYVIIDNQMKETTVWINLKTELKVQKC